MLASVITLMHDINYSIYSERKIAGDNETTPQIVHDYL